MKILLDCGTKMPLPVSLYGGTQRVVWDLAKELSELGHRVTLLAAKGSVCPFAERILFRDPSIPIEKQIPEDVDVCHFQNNVVSKMNTEKPYVITMHGNVAANREMDLNTIFVSKNHALRYGADAYVYNGLDWERYPKNPITEEREYYHFLGKGTFPGKNLTGTIELMKRICGERLSVMGARRISFQKGFRWTFSNRVVFHGMVDDNKKCRILSRSKGLLFPVLWHEPFGLAIIESLFMGCPVFGTKLGSLPELVPKEVGYLSNRAEELVAHLGEFQSLKERERCREYVTERFHSRRMAERYVRYYEKVMNGETCNGAKPVTSVDTKGVVMSNKEFFAPATARR